MLFRSADCLGQAEILVHLFNCALINGKTVVGDHCDRPTSGFNLRHRQIHSKKQVGGLRDSTLRLRLSVVSPILHFRCYISVPQVKNLGLAYRRSLRLRITKYVHRDYGLTRLFQIRGRLTMLVRQPLKIVIHYRA